MMGTINKPKTSPGPHSDVARQALDLLAAFGGGDKKLKNILKDMIEIRDHNDKVLEHCLKHYDVLSKQAEQIEKKIKDHEEKGKNFREEVGKESKKLEQRNLDLNLREERFNKNSSDALTKLHNFEHELKKREAKLSADQQILRDATRALELSQEEVDQRGMELESREEKINSLLQQLKSIINSVD